VAKELGLALGGWHDCRHTLSTQTTLSVYQHVETDQCRAPLNEVATELLPDVTKLAASRAWKGPDVTNPNAAAYVLIRRIFYWFGVERDEIPYTSVASNGSRIVDENLIINSR
jgi:hypothetical protein